MSEPASTAAWLAANPRADAEFRQSLAGVARRALAPGFRAIAIAQSPAAFRRRGIFIAAGAERR